MKEFDNSNIDKIFSEMDKERRLLEEKERINNIVIGNRIAKIRKEKNILQKDLAEKLDIPASTLANYETGRRTITVEALLKIGKELNFTVDEILQDNNPKELFHISFLSDNLKEYRKRFNFTQEEVGEHIGKSGSYIKYLETEQNANPNLDTLLELSAEVGLNLESLVRENVFLNIEIKNEIYKENYNIRDEAYNLFEWYYKMNSLEDKYNLTANEFAYMKKGFMDSLVILIEKSIEANIKIYKDKY